MNGNSWSVWRVVCSLSQIASLHLCLSPGFHSTLARQNDFADAPDAAASAASSCLLLVCSAVSSGPHEPGDTRYSEPPTEWRPLLNLQPTWPESMRRGVQEKAQVFVLQLQAVQRHLRVERQVQQQPRRQPCVRRGNDVQRPFVLARRESIDSSSLLLVYVSREDDVQRLFILARRESIDSSSLLLVCGETRRPSVLIFTAVFCCCFFFFFFFLIMMIFLFAWGFILFPILFISLLVCLFVPHGPMWRLLIKPWHECFTLQWTFLPHMRCWLRVKTQMRHLKMYIATE